MIPIISVTGTKGKTSVVRATEHVVRSFENIVVRVDTEGAWLNNQQKYTHDESKRIWGLAPANAPGRFITLVGKNDGAAILECNLFCSKACGLGYSSHKVGVFTNVYEDHKGADKTLQSKADIARAKSFIFSRIALNGYAVYNADDEHILAQLPKISTKKNITRIACSVTQDITDAHNCLFLNEQKIIYRQGKQTSSFGELGDYSMYVKGFVPSAYNLLLTLGALIAYFDGKLAKEAIQILQAYQPSEEDGRLVTFKTAEGVIVILDFAHEKESLLQIVKFAHTLSPKGKTIGLLRLSPTRSDNLIDETAEAIADAFDHFIIYDKIDGINRKPDDSLNPFRPEEIGRTSKLFAKQLSKHGAKNVIHEIEESRALKKATLLASKDDVIIYVQGNDPKMSLNMLKHAFDNKIERITP